ncbi:heterokaryon incompatibility protein-domain-containing protein [Xylariales sp. PMI_506]|nr:heterokaryon incompatibility protein-domain-containing protein [Xylariales sp. PMI_506]
MQPNQTVIKVFDEPLAIVGALGNSDGLRHHGVHPHLNEHVVAASYLGSLFLFLGCIGWLSSLDVYDQEAQDIPASVQRVESEVHDLSSDKPRKSEVSPYTCLQGDEFRLLILDPGGYSDDVRCRLVVLEREGGCRFEALSYAWGGTQKSNSIVCNDLPLGVTDNLAEALRHLRFPDETRILWVDAICIDQDDIEERQHQVGLMRTIFSDAVRVVVWLGPSGQDVKGAFDLLLTIRDYITAPVDYFELGSNFSSVKTFEKLARHNWAPLVTLLERPWFTRLWVFQEVALAQEVVVQCGYDQISWSTLASIFRYLDHKGIVLERFTWGRGLASVGVRALIAMDRYRQLTQNGAPRDLISILLATSGSDCTDLHDKIYAVQSLATADGAPLLEPDYRISAAEAFKLLAVRCIQSGHLEILSCSERQDVWPLQELSGLPSWVPDWTRVENTTPFALWRINSTTLRQGTHRRAELFPESCPLNCSLPIQVTEDSVLLLPALFVDRISALAAPSSFTKTPFSKKWRSWDYFALSKNRDWILECESLGSRGAGRSAPAELWKVLTASLDGNARPAPENFPKAFREYRRYLDVVDAWRRDDPEAMSELKHRPLDVPLITAIESSLHMWSSRRRFAVTESGRMVLAPKRSREGDVIVLPAWYAIPLVLRPIDDARYELVGEAYVEDVMSGKFSSEINKGYAEAEASCPLFKYYDIV